VNDEPGPPLFIVHPSSLCGHAIGIRWTVMLELTEIPPETPHPSPSPPPGPEPAPAPQRDPEPPGVPTPNPPPTPHPDPRRGPEALIVRPPAGDQT